MLTALAGNGDPYGFHLRSLLVDYGTCLLAVIGSAFILWRRQWRNMFPVILMCSVYGMFSHHRPYWAFYHPHFAVPMAWLAGIGLEESWNEFWKTGPTLATRGWLKSASRAAWLLVLSVVLVGTWQNVTRAFGAVSGERTVRQMTLARAVEPYRGIAKWFFSDQALYAFHAGLPVPPQLAVLSKKRFWSGQITSQEVVLTAQQYRPELVLLGRWFWNDPVVGPYLAQEYIRIGEDRSGILYLRKDLPIQNRQSTSQGVPVLKEPLTATSFPR